MGLESLSVQPVRTRLELKRFIQLPYRLYQNDPHWIAPLYSERKEILHPQKNPFYQHAIVELFLAVREGKEVGRISAQIDFEYEKCHGERVGHFGFFECEQDPEIAAALFQAAENFLKQNQATRIVGPFSFSINEESGLLIDGFDQPLMTMMPYNPPYYADLIEGVGYRKIKDLYAWHYPVGEIPEQPRLIAEEVRKLPDLILRTFDKKNFKRDMNIIIDIFNSAWSENWGFVPLTSAEVDKMAKDLKLFIDYEGAFIAEYKGIPIAMALAMPNLYELIAGMKGRLFPFGIFKLLWRLFRKQYRSARLMLLGIKKEYRSSMLGFLSTLLYVEIHRRGLERGYEWGELSWTLEDNRKVNTGIEFMGGKKYKTFRIYEKG